MSSMDLETDQVDIPFENASSRGDGLQQSENIEAVELGTESTQSQRANRLDFSSSDFPDLTHYLFRYPAKFHPPVARELIERYSEPGDRVLDPFCGSGTLLVEALTMGRRAVGTDIDPLAIFSTKVKTHRYRVGLLRREAEKLKERLLEHRRPADDYIAMQWPHADIDEEEMWSTLEEESLWVPDIPNLLHWFRKYVVVDLARIFSEIRTMDVFSTHRQFFRLCFASIIRRSSNADPVPVSGLEYTSHMKKKDKNGRIVNPFELMGGALDDNLDAVEEFRDHTDTELCVALQQKDVLELSKYTNQLGTPIDTIITSPPYHSAVDYYRRHQLEIFWLRFVESQRQRVEMKHDYIGRPTVLVDDPFLDDEYRLPPRSRQWHDEMKKISPKRARAFKHYTVAMQKTLAEFQQALTPGSHVVLVVGHSTWNGNEIPTTSLLAELMPENFIISDILWYPIKNRYMSYSRHNGASIDKEYVLAIKHCG